MWYQALLLLACLAVELEAERVGAAAVASQQPAPPATPRKRPTLPVLLACR